MGQFKARGVKPDAVRDDEMGTAPLLTFVLWLLLPILADRDGRLEDRPRRIAADLFPYRPEVTAEIVAAELDTLVRMNRVYRYEVAGQKIIQLLDFSKLQSPHHTERVGTLPAPELVESTEVANTHGEITVKQREYPLILDTDTDTDTDSDYGVPPPVAAAAAAGSEQRTANNEQPDDPRSDCPIETRIWLDGVEILKRSGLSETQSRPLLGRLAKDYGKALLAECIAATLAENPADPKAYLVKTVRHRSRANPAATVGKSDYVEPKFGCRRCFDSGSVATPKPGGKEWEFIEQKCPNC